MKEKWLLFFVSRCIFIFIFPSRPIQTVKTTNFGATAPHNESQNTKLETVTYSRGPCVQTVRTRGSVMSLFCITGGPLLNSFKRYIQYCGGTHGAPQPRKFSSNFLTVLRRLGQFFAFIIRGPQVPSGKIFGNCT